MAGAASTVRLVAKEYLSATASSCGPACLQVDASEPGACSVVVGSGSDTSGMTTSMASDTASPVAAIG